MACELRQAVSERCEAKPHISDDEARKAVEDVDRCRKELAA
jgi:hypothetical protein